MLDKIQAISDPTRYAIIELLRDKEMPAGKIAGEFKSITRPAVSQHLRVLKNKGLLSERREGTKRLYSIRNEGFIEIYQFLSKFWDVRLQKLQTLAEMEELKKCQLK
ncbi:MAG: transcriptional regulator [Thermodesulfobacteriota bacterium]|nr:MAG: transcriptional regulator [Thermodesulfobacteriota bacterium]